MRAFSQQSGRKRKKRDKRSAVSFRALFESLLNRKLTPRDGLIEKANWAPMPGKLREFYRVAGRVDSINRCHNRLYRPHKLDDENGYRIFMEENQNVVAWAFRIEDAEQDNPPIYVASCMQDGRMGKWFAEKLACAGWLVSMVYWQVVNGGFRFGAYKESRRDLRRRLAAHWPRILTDPGPGEAPMSYYGRGGQMLAWCGRKRGSLYAAGRTLRDLRQIHRRLRIEWSYSDLDEVED